MSRCIFSMYGSRTVCPFTGMPMGDSVVGMRGGQLAACAAPGDDLGGGQQAACALPGRGGTGLKQRGTASASGPGPPAARWAGPAVAPVEVAVAPASGVHVLEVSEVVDGGGVRDGPTGRRRTSPESSGGTAASGAGLVAPEAGGAVMQLAPVLQGAEQAGAKQQAAAATLQESVARLERQAASLQGSVVRVEGQQAALQASVERVGGQQAALQEVVGRMEAQLGALVLALAAQRGTHAAS